MSKTIGLDIGKSAIKISIVENNKLVKSQIIDVAENEPKFVLQKLKRFLDVNKLNSVKANVLIKDYRTKRIKIDRLRGWSLKNALLFEREEKIGTSEILGDNYKDNHVIQKKTNNVLDILLAVVNEDEVDVLGSFLSEAGIKDINYYMECFVFNDIAPDNSVIVDIGYSSIQLMFFDRKKVAKTSLMKKGILDIIEELKDKVDENIKLADMMRFTLIDKDEPMYDVVTSKLGLYAENIINGINTFARENSKNVKTMNVYYTGGIFAINGMAEYLNYLMGIEGRILKVYGQKEEPLFNNSIALAYKDGTKGRINLGWTDLSKKLNKFFSCAVFISAVFLLTVGAYRGYGYFTASKQNQIVEKAYTEKKKVYDSVTSDYNQLTQLIKNSRSEDNNAKNLSELLSYIQSSMSSKMTIKKLEMNSSKMITIEATAADYTDFGVFCTKLKKVFENYQLKKLIRSDDTTVVFRLECTL